MDKIELSEKEIQVIKDQLNGDIDGWTATEEQQKLLTGVINKAEALMDELNAYDDDFDDLIQWFWDKYQRQNK